MALSNAVEATDKLDWDSAPAPIASTTCIQPFDNAGFAVPHDVLVLASSSHRAYIPLSLLCRPAILDAKACKRSGLLDGDGKVDALALEPYLNLEDVMDFASWSQAMTMLHLVLEQVMGAVSAKKYGAWLRSHQHQIRARLSEDAWPVLRRYDIDMRKLFWEEYRKAEAAAGQDGKGRAFEMPKWDPKAYEAAAASFGTTASDLDSLHKDSRSSFGKCLDLVNTALKPSTLSSVATSTSHSVRGQKVSPALAAAIGITERLKQTAHQDAIARLQASGRILAGSASYAATTASPVAAPVPIAPSPSPSDALYHDLVQRQATLIRQLQQQNATPPAPQLPQRSYTRPGGPLPSGTLPPLHPNGRLLPPSAVDTVNAFKRAAPGFAANPGPRPRNCPMCGVAEPDHAWTDCRTFNPDAVYRLGRGFAIQGTSQPVCANFNGGGCTMPDCTFVHGCTRCRLVPYERSRAHGHQDCKAGSLSPMGGPSSAGTGRAPLSFHAFADPSSGNKRGGALATGSNNIPAKRPADAQLAKAQDPALTNLLENGAAAVTDSWGLAASPTTGEADLSFLDALFGPKPPLEELYHNPSNLNACAFEKYLARLPHVEASPYRSIPVQIRQGFHLGICFPVVEPYFPPNAEMTDAEVEAVDDSIRKDVAKRRLAGPYNPAFLAATLGIYFRSSPLSCRLKYTPPGKPQKRRLIENLSFPYQPSAGGTTSVNSNLDSTEFPSRWTKLATLLDALRRLPAASTVMVTDLTDAFKQLPIHPSQRPHHGIVWRGALFFRKTPSFGGRTTPGTFCNVVDCVLDILEALFPTIFTSNIVDDLLFARFGDPPTPSDAIFAVLRELGVEWSEEKTQPWSRRFKFGGVWIDLEEMTVELDREKREKYALKLERFTEGRAHGAKRLDEVLSMMGTLLYVCEIIPSRRPRLHAFLCWRRRYPASPMSARHLTRSVLDELDDWLQFLRGPNEIKASFALPPRISNHSFFTDASTSGLGVVVDGRYAVAYSLSPRWARYAAEPGQIAAAEAWAVEIVGSIVEAWDLADVAVFVGVDNTNVVNGFAKGRAANRLVNNAIRRLSDAMQLRNVVLFLRYVNTKKNPADAVSRGFIDDRLSPLPFRIQPPPGTIEGPTP
ncbi:hypothetical protein JCM1841_002258 [Sporobolomyces salmonicolor]